MTRTRIKVCGVTSEEAARAAGALGIDAVGLVFWSGSSRAVSPQRAASIAAALPPFVTPVALFLDPEPAEVEVALKAVPAAILQFHGNESAGFCESFKRPWIKAIGMEVDADCRTIAAPYRRASGLLVDSHRPGEAGGSGRSFDWNRIPQDLDLPLILAGGLTPNNVAEAIRTVGPYGIDVSSGVERTKGEKDALLMRELTEEVQRVDRGD